MFNEVKQQFINFLKEEELDDEYSWEDTVQEFNGVEFVDTDDMLNADYQEYRWHPEGVVRAHFPGGIFVEDDHMTWVIFDNSLITITPEQAKGIAGLLGYPNNIDDEKYSYQQGKTYSSCDCDKAECYWCN
jgi:hypothetical protein